MNIDARLLANWDSAKSQWRVAAGKYVFAVGDSAEALGTTTEINLKARTLKP
jgi:hypothetical protein